jgi:hypothetical protein
VAMETSDSTVATCAVRGVSGAATPPGRVRLAVGCGFTGLLGQVRRTARRTGTHAPSVPRGSVNRNAVGRADTAPGRGPGQSASGRALISGPVLDLCCCQGHIMQGVDLTRCGRPGHALAFGWSPRQARSRGWSS